MNYQSTESAKYISQVRLFGIYCQDYGICYNLTQQFTSCLKQFRQDLHVFINNQQKTCQEIQSQAVRNIADLLFRKINQAAFTVVEMTSKFQAMTEDIKSKHRCMQSIKLTNDTAVDRVIQIIQNKQDSLNDKEETLARLLADKDKQYKEWLVSKLVNNSYGLTTQEQSFDTIDWRITQLRQQIDTLHADITCHKEAFELKCCENSCQLAIATRKLLELRVNQEWKQVTFGEYLLRDVPKEEQAPSKTDDQVETYRVQKRHPRKQTLSQ